MKKRKQEKEMKRAISLDIDERTMNYFPKKHKIENRNTIINESEERLERESYMQKCKGCLAAKYRSYKHEHNLTRVRDICDNCICVFCLEEVTKQTGICKKCKNITRLINTEIEYRETEFKINEEKIKELLKKLPKKGAIGSDFDHACFLNDKDKIILKQIEILKELEKKKWKKIF
jgi:hypothetical protein